MMSALLSPVVSGEVPTAASLSAADSAYIVSQVPHRSQANPLASGSPDLSPYTVDAVRARLPSRFTGRSAHVLPIDELYFLHVTNIIEMDRVWAANGNTRPRCLVLGRGAYSLETVHRQIGDPSVLAREGDGSYLLHLPLYISPTATLALSDGDRLKLSSRDGVFIYSNGELVVADSEITVWDPVSDRYGSRKALSKASALYYRKQTPRPYILASEGSRTYVGNSRLRGLGYHGAAGTFGISFNVSINAGRLGDYLKRLPLPTGWLIGNRIENLFFGFYSNRARDVVIVGNQFRDNVIYGIDPHDYSERLIVARNVAEGSTFAHGIIFSRGVRDSWIVENLAIDNAGSGIMLDRNSTENRVLKNLVLGNEGDGIALFESDRNVLSDNVVRRNARNGIYVRNSEKLSILSNEVGKNGASGIEIAVVDISSLETRNFALDPYYQRAAADVWRNTFEDNGRSAVKVRSADSLSLYDNKYVDSGPAYFSGDLRPHASVLLEGELRQNVRTVIERRSRLVERERAVSKASAAGDANEGATAIQIIRRYAEGGSPRAMVALARHHARDWSDEKARRETIYWYARAIMHGNTGAMGELGILLLRGESGPAERDEGIVLLSMAVILGDARARADLKLLPDVLGIPPEDLEGGWPRARLRLRSRQPWNAALYPDIPIRLSVKEDAAAYHRLGRLYREIERGRVPDSASEGGRLPPRLDPKRKARYARIATMRNRKRSQYHARLEAERNLDEQAFGARRAYLDRVHRRREGAELKVGTFSPGERQVLIDRVTQLLARINLHRSADAQLGVEDLDLSSVRARAGEHP